MFPLPIRPVRKLTASPKELLVCFDAYPVSTLHAPPNACLTLCLYAGEEYAAKYAHLDKLFQTL
ncbi:hypothetical protein EKTHUN627_16680 [Enterobacter kobei]|nr:hypothetical protein EKTHUN627_16680 [Enterobacter kobei]